MGVHGAMNGGKKKVRKQTSLMIGNCFHFSWWSIIQRVRNPEAVKLSQWDLRLRWMRVHMEASAVPVYFWTLVRDAFEYFFSATTFWSGKNMFGKICPPEVAKAVHRLRSEDKTLKQVASYFGHGEEWARRIMLNYDEASGLPKFTPKSPGRPRKTTLEEDGKMLELAKGDDARPSSGQIATAMKDSGTAISSSTVRRRLRDSHVRRRKNRDLCSFSTLLSVKDRAGLFSAGNLSDISSINQSINR